MSRQKSGDPARAPRTQPPAWWKDEVERLCAKRTKAEIVAELNKASRLQPPISDDSVYDFFNGKGMTDRLRDAFLALFRDLPPPNFVAGSLEEAVRVRDLARSSQGRSMRLPEWWLGALQRRCSALSIPESAHIAELLNNAGNHQPFSSAQVQAFLDGKLTTDVMMEAFLTLFPDLPPPVIWASSYEEAHRLQQVARTYPKPLLDDAPKVAAVSTTIPKVSETIEDTGEMVAEPTQLVKKRR